MFGIQLLLHNKPAGWTTAKGKRLEFATYEDAQCELADWKKHCWWPSKVKYVIKPIEE